MKSNKFFPGPIFFLLFISSACSSITIEGSGNIIVDDREINDVDSIIFSGTGEVTVEQGDEESLTIITDDNILPYVQTEVKNKKLILSFDGKDQNKYYNPTNDVKFNLVVRNLSQIEVSGGGNIKINKLATGKLLIDKSGAGSLEIASLTTDELIIRQSGAGRVNVSGLVKRQEVTHSGVGSYHAGDLISQSTFLTISEAGSATVWVEEFLDVKISGSGKVIYYGTPQIIQDVSGLGKLINAHFNDEQGVSMALVHSGSFEMGSYFGADDKQPVHTVRLGDFYMDQYEVTNSQYTVCEAAGICDSTTDTSAYESSYSRRSYYDNPEYADYPLMNVNWFEAQKYCNWRGARLPTEAEWEKAARGGLEEKKYPWGDEAPVCEEKAENGAKFADGKKCNNTDTEKVGSYKPNGYGLYDMAGNLWEWVSDFYDEDYYNNSPDNNPSGPATGMYPAVRGGSWQSSVDHLRVSDRRFNDPKSGSFNIGFRCVRTDLSPLPITPEGSKEVIIPQKVPVGERGKLIDLMLPFAFPL